jgi:hypothetical protein
MLEPNFNPGHQNQNHNQKPTRTSHHNQIEETITDLPIKEMTVVNPRVDIK